MTSVNVNEQLVRHVAMLAKLNLSESEVSNYVNYMKQILNYVETLDQVDTSNVEPLFSPVMHVEEFTTHEDQVKAFEAAANILRNAPKREEGQYKIKAIIEEQ